MDIHNICLYIASIPTCDMTREHGNTEYSELPQSLRILYAVCTCLVSLYYPIFILYTPHSVLLLAASHLTSLFIQNGKSKRQKRKYRLELYIHLYFLLKRGILWAAGYAYNTYGALSMTACIVYIVPYVYCMHMLRQVCILDEFGFCVSMSYSAHAFFM